MMTWLSDPIVLIFAAVAGGWVLGFRAGVDGCNAVWEKRLSLWKKAR